MRICRKELEDEGTLDVERTLEEKFPSWFKKHIAKRYVDGETISEDLYALACEPDLRVRVFSACIVGGVRYHTIDREKNRRSQNSGVMMEGTHNEEYIDYYGCLKEIIQLQYNSYLREHRTVVLFRCDWFDTDGNKDRLKDDGFLRSIYHGSYWYKNDPFILATQSTKVFYLKDNVNGENWRIVQKFSHRHLWSVAENDVDETGPSGIGLSYQDDEFEGPPVQVNEGTLENEQPNDEGSYSVDASVVDEARRQMEEAPESSDDEDETIFQYADDNKGPTIIDDDDSDSE